MKTLLLKFAGPLQSWGTESHFETRHTDYHPSKSAVIGMIAACFGYRRDEEEKIRPLNDLQFAVRVDQEGGLIRDYQIAQKYKDNGSLERSYVTHRYYLEDAVFVAAVGCAEDQMAYKIGEALQCPYFQPFLGRRSIPLTADSYLGIREGGPMDALTELPWQAAKWYKKNNVNHVPVYADLELIPSSVSKLRRDQVLSFSQVRGRAFQYREESMTYIDAPYEEEHDAFSGMEV